MGSQESKVQPPQSGNVLKETTSMDSVPSTPILTPLDPRSPSANIARTPLEVILGSKGCEDTGDELDELEEEFADTKDVVNVILGIDPRSPTVEFNRTPIIVASINKEKSAKLYNKNLENVRKSEIQTTPVTTARKSSHIQPPKLLESSPVSVISNYYKRKSFVGLLETNLDFTETDLDTVCQAKDILHKSLPLEMTEDIPSNNLKTQMDNLQIDQKCVISEVNEDNEISKDEKKLQLSYKNTLEEKVVNITAQVKDFDKKLTNLIYEDDSDSDDDNKLRQRVIKVKENNRTPLGIRNGNDDPKKAKMRLRVSDKPRKFEISKIPVFKDNGRRIKVQCENTPPQKLEEFKSKPKMPQWDSDKTLII